ncbi:MAG: hypothetical protein HQL30_10590 [Candidatus Omnitrophica bacterium]|nr:hypothetical protein [Candidatus Omnitrophota bacterium]
MKNTIYKSTLVLSISIIMLLDQAIVASAGQDKEFSTGKISTLIPGPKTGSSLGAAISIGQKSAVEGFIKRKKTQTEQKRSAGKTIEIGGYSYQAGVNDITGIAEFNPVNGNGQILLNPAGILQNGNMCYKAVVRGKQAELTELDTDIRVLEKGTTKEYTVGKLTYGAKDFCKKEINYYRKGTRKLSVREEQELAITEPGDDPFGKGRVQLYRVFFDPSGEKIGHTYDSVNNIADLADLGKGGSGQPVIFSRTIYVKSETGSGDEGRVTYNYTVWGSLYNGSGEKFDPKAIDASKGPWAPDLKGCVLSDIEISLPKDKLTGKQKKAFFGELKYRTPALNAGRSEIKTMFFYSDSSAEETAGNHFQKVTVYGDKMVIADIPVNFGNINVNYVKIEGDGGRIERDFFDNSGKLINHSIN